MKTGPLALLLLVVGVCACIDSPAPRARTTVASRSAVPLTMRTRTASTAEEWFREDPRGLEHGITLHEGPIQAHVDIGPEYEAVPSRRPGTIDLRRKGETSPRFRYSGLHVLNADGSELQATMHADGDGIAIQSDATNAAYPVVIDPLVWAGETVLDPLPTPSPGQFGFSVAISGDRLAVGARAGDDDFTGSAYVFRHDGAAWVEESHLSPPYPMANLVYGSSLAFAGDRLVVGTGNPAYEYTRQGVTWNRSAPYATDYQSTSANGALVATFAESTAVYSSDYAEPDAPNGIVFVFSTADEHVERLAVPQRPPLGTIGAVVMDEGTIAIGVNAKVFVFRRSGAGSWSIEATLTEPEVTGASFGHALALAGDELIVGYPGSKHVSIYRRKGTGWSLTQKLEGPVDNDVSFGASLALHGASFAVGSPQLYPGGGAFTYTRKQDRWALDAEIDSPAPTLAQNFGFALALDDTRLVIGSPLEHGDGRVYVHARVSDLGDLCTENTRCASGHCVDGVCCESACGDGAVDCQSCNQHKGHCEPVAAAVACRPAAGPCDRAEVCDGKSSSCPRDGIAPDGTACSGGYCRGGACFVPPSADANADAGDDLTAATPRPNSSDCAMGRSPGNGFGFGFAFILGVLAFRRRAWALFCALAFVAVLSLPRIVLRSSIVALASFGRIGAAGHEGGAREWWKSTPQGLEHGFDVAARIPGDTPLLFELAISDPWRPRRDGQRIVLDHVDGRSLIYGELVAVDAAGRKLPASLSVRGERIGIEVDDREAEYPIVVDPILWMDRQRLTRPTPEEGGLFGAVLAVDGDDLLIARPRSGDAFGEVWAYRRNGNDWRSTGRLVVPEGQAKNDAFGNFIAVSRGLAVIGAPGAGVAYVFRRSGEAWAFEAKLDGGANGPAEQFGLSTATDGATIFVSSPLALDENEHAIGAVQEFHRSKDGKWSEGTRLAIGVPDLAFGAVLAMDSETLLIGVPYVGVPRIDPPGYVLFFERLAGEWGIVFEAERTRFGLATYPTDLALHGDVAAASETLASQGRGHVDLFRRSGGVWRAEQSLHGPDERGNLAFGGSVRLTNDTLLVGSPKTEGNRGTGYLYTWRDQSWELEQALAPAAAPDENVGFNVALNEDMALLGAPGANGGTGAVYVLYHGELGTPCETGARCASGACVDGVCCDTTCGSGSADDCVACSVAAGAAVDGTCSLRRSGVCRPAASECDVPESCGGESASCPDDDVKSNGIPCNGGVCSAGTCLASIPISTPAPQPDPAAPVAPPAVEQAPGRGGCSVVSGTAGPTVFGSFVLCASLVALRRRRRGSVRVLALLLLGGVVALVACRRTDDATPFRARFDRDGRAFVRTADDVVVGFNAPRFGRGEALQSLDAVEPETWGERTVFRTAAISEWFEHTTTGIEQGFDLPHRLAGAGTLTLRVPLQDGTSVARVSETAIDLRVGDAGFRYGAALATDARGERLPLRLGVDADRRSIELHIDDANAVYPVTIDPLLWSFAAELERLDSVEVSSFGREVAISGEHIAVTAPFAMDGGGAAYVYERNAGTWQSSTVLQSPSSEPGFGRSVSLDGDTLVVTGSDMVALYQLAAGSWQRTAVLPFNLDPQSLAPRAIVRGDTIVGSVTFALPLGAPAGTPTNTVIVVWTRDGDGWHERSRWELPLPPTGATSGALAFDGERIVFGAGNAVYVYRRQPDGTWPLEASIPPPQVENTSGIAFGYAVAIEGDTLIATNTSGADQAYLFAYARGAKGWELAQVVDTDLRAPVNVGSALALRGDVAFINQFETAGRATRLVRRAGSWIIDEQIELPEASPATNIISIAMTDLVAVFGTPSQGAKTGAVYVLELRASLGEPCKTTTDCASDFCVDGVCCDTSCGGGDPRDCLSCNETKTRGTCAAASATTTCRAAAGDCDAPESCDGKALTCPADTLADNGKACSAGICVNGTCTTENPAPSTATGPTADAGAFEAPLAPGACSAAPSKPGSPEILVALAAIVALLLARRTRIWIWALALLGAVLPARGAVRALSYEQGGWWTDFEVDGAKFGVGRKTMLTLRTHSFGRINEMQRLAATRPAREDARIVYAHDGITEWYRRVPSGIEHGFDLHARPSGAGALLVRLQIGQGEALRHEGDGIVAVSGFHYGEIHAADADERPLRVAASLIGDAVELSIDDRGARYPVQIDPLIWRDTPVLEPPSTATGGLFGSALATQNDQLVVGAPVLRDGGGVFVYVRDGFSWSLTGRLRPAELLYEGARFGQAVAIDGDRIVVGAPFTLTQAPTGDFLLYGALWVFERRGEHWVETAKLQLRDPVHGDELGTVVAISGDVIAATASLRGGFDEKDDAQGSVTTWHHTAAGEWIEDEELTPLEGHRYFGNSLAFHGDILVIGASAAQFNPRAAGAVYFYSRKSGHFHLDHVEVAEQRPSGGNFFGDRVALSGSTVVATSNLANGQGPQVFERSGTTWKSSLELSGAIDGLPASFIPIVSSFVGSRLLLSAPLLDRGRGASFLIERSGSEWRETQRFEATEPRREDDAFGTRAVQSDHLAMISAPSRNGGTGAVYTFELGPDSQACVAATECASGFCVDGFCCDSACGGGDTSDCLACSVAAGAARNGYCSPSKPRVCRAAVDECDRAENCDGTNATCPADVTAVNGATCGANGQCVSGRCVDVVPVSNADAGIAPDLEPPRAAGGGCATTGGAGAGALILIGLVGGVVRRRKRRGA